MSRELIYIESLSSRLVQKSAVSNYPERSSHWSYSKSKRSHYKWIVLIVILIVIIALIALTVTTFNESKGSVKIISITHSPEKPDPGDDITITAIVDNSLECFAYYISFFASKGGGSGTMKQVDHGIFEFKISSENIKSGTEIWYIISAKGYDESFAVSNESSVQIGYIERSNITSLNISNITYDPPMPSINDQSVLISADIVSNVTILEAEIGYIFLHPSGISGTSNAMMIKKSGTTYEYRLQINSNGGFHFHKDTKIFFKLGVQDGFENTLVSAIHSFVIS